MSQGKFHTEFQAHFSKIPFFPGLWVFNSLLSWQPQAPISVSSPNENVKIPGCVNLLGFYSLIYKLANDPG